MYAAPVPPDFHRLEALPVDTDAPGQFDWAPWWTLLRALKPVVAARVVEGASLNMPTDPQAPWPPGGPGLRVLGSWGEPPENAGSPDADRSSGLALEQRPMSADIGIAQGATTLQYWVWRDPQPAPFEGQGTRASIDPPEPAEGALNALLQAWQRALLTHRRLQDSQRSLRGLLDRLDWIEQSLNFAREVVWEIDAQTRKIRYSRFTTVVDTSGQADPLGSFSALLETLHPEDRAPALEAFEGYLRGELPEFYAEYRQRLINGQWIWSRSRGRAVSFDEQGRPLRIQGTVVGVSKLKALEATLRESVDNRTQFLATMSHEFRTPLNSIIGASQLSLLEQDPEVLKEQLALIGSASRHLLGLINSVLDYSRLEAQAMQLESRPLSLHRLLADLALRFEPEAAQRGVALRIDLDPDTPSSVTGDEMRLSQVLNNLLANALKFTDAGRVTLVVEPRELGPEACRIEFSVQDTGIGMNAEQVRRLFQPYSQADVTIARRYGGTGLGLVICRQLVALMGGELQVFSAPEQGSTFSFVISMPRVGALDEAPAQGQQGGHGMPSAARRSVEGRLDILQAQQTAAERLAAALQAARDHVAGRRVVIVDDNRMNILVLERFLARVGVQSRSFESARAAIAALRAEGADVVLMDLYMPEMNGAEATREIRQSPGLERIPILAVSASVTPQERELCREAGMNDFVAKPIEPLILIETIKRHLPQAASTGLPSF